MLEIVLNDLVIYISLPLVCKLFCSMVRSTINGFYDRGLWDLNKWWQFLYSSLVDFTKKFLIFNILTYSRGITAGRVHQITQK